MPYVSRVFAGVEVVPLCDAVGPMGESIRRPLPEMFPGGDFAADEEWILHFHCHLLRTDEGIVLVDTGIGGFDSPAAGWAPVPGRLPQELAAAGVDPAEIDLVVLTHLHSDHVSGCVIDGEPAFPNARYVIQQAELDWVGGGLMRERIVAPLKDALQIVDGRADLIGGIRVSHTPGHTPGHQVVVVGDLVICGDIVHHPAQLADPSIVYLYDVDPAEAAKSRAAVFDYARVLAGSHLPEPFTTLPPSARPAGP